MMNRIRVRAPLRISFMGGRSDFPAFYEQEEGYVVSTTIDKYVFVEMAHCQKGLKLNAEVQENCNTIEELKHPIVKWALQSYQFLEESKGLKVDVKSDVPSGTGLGSSSALSVACLKASQLFSGHDLAADTLAQKTAFFEISERGQFTGKQDAYASAYGGFNAFRFLQDGKVEAELGLLDSQKAEHLQSAITVLYTQKSRIGSQIFSCEKEKFAFSQVLKMRNLAYDFFSELKGNMSVPDLGKILHEGWAYKKEVNSLISNSEIDDLYSLAMDAGAYGGKLLGAGGGGYLMLLTNPETQKKLRNKLSANYFFPISFTAHGVEEVK